MDQQGQNNHGPQTNVGGKVDSAYSGTIDQIGDRYIVNPDGFEEELSDRELLRDIHDLLLGNARKGREKGLVHIVSEMRQDIENLYHFTWGLIVALVTVVILVAYLFIVTSQTPSTTMQKPHEAAIHTERQVDDQDVGPGYEQEQN